MTNFTKPIPAIILEAFLGPWCIGPEEKKEEVDVDVFIRMATKTDDAGKATVAGYTVAAIQQDVEDPVVMYLDTKGAWWKDDVPGKELVFKTFNEAVFVFHKWTGHPEEDALESMVPVN